MNYWNILSQDVIQKGKNTAFLLMDLEETQNHAQCSLNTIRDLRTYYLTPHYPTIYFTKREAECAFWIIQNKTIEQTAHHMNLSPRTVEFYVKNMKLKLKCENKKRLIEVILASDLSSQLEKDGMKMTQH